MAELWAYPEKTVKANSELTAGAQDLKDAIVRILTGISLQKEGVGAPKFDEERDRVEGSARELQSTVDTFAARIIALAEAGSAQCQRSLVIESKVAEIWGDPIRWQDEELPELPPGFKPPDSLPPDFNDQG